MKQLCKQARRASASCLVCDERGTGVVELALITPVIAMLLVGMVDTSMGMAQKLKLERAAAQAIERVTAYGQVETSYPEIRTEAAEAAGVPVSSVVIDNWLECNSDGVAPTRNASFTGACTNGQQVARYVSVSITGGFTPLLHYGSVFRTSGNGGIVMRGDASVRIQ
jgi:Flp pilus assembly protein TadG